VIFVCQPEGAENLKVFPAIVSAGASFFPPPPPQPASRSAARVKAAIRGYTRSAESERKETRIMVRGKAKVYEAAGSAKPYVDRALHDEELRENVRNAYAAAREIYDELSGGRRTGSVATKLATDTDIHENLHTAIDELRTAARRVQGKEHRGR